RKIIHDGVILSLTRGIRILILWVIRAGTDDVLSVVWSVQHDKLRIVCGKLIVFLVGIHPTRQVIVCLGLVFRGVFLGVGLQDGALFFACFWQRHGVGALWGVQHPSNKAVFTFPNWCRCALTAHGAVDGFNGHFAGKGWGISLPRGNQSLT